MRNIELEEWQNEIDNYLWLTQKNTGAVTCYANNKTVLGQILLGEEFRNKIYEKTTGEICSQTCDFSKQREKM